MVCAAGVGCNLHLMKANIGFGGREIEKASFTEACLFSQGCWEFAVRRVVRYCSAESKQQRQPEPVFDPKAQYLRWHTAPLSNWCQTEMWPKAIRCSNMMSPQNIMHNGRLVWCSSEQGSPGTRHIGSRPLFFQNKREIHRWVSSRIISVPLVDRIATMTTPNQTCSPASSA